MLKILYELCSSKSIVSLYTDYQDMSKFHFGTVLAVNGKEIAIHMITPDGEDDGISVMNVEDVVRAEVGGQYAKKMEVLCSDQSLSDYKIEIKDDNILISVLSYAISNEQLISIELLDSGHNDIVGFAKIMPGGECIINQVDEYGFEDGVSYVSINDITMITLLSQDEKRIAKLWKLNK